MLEMYVLPANNSINGELGSKMKFT